MQHDIYHQKSKFCISDTFKLHYDVNHVDNIVKLYLNEKFDRGKMLIEKYNETNRVLNEESLTVVEYLNLEDSLKKSKECLKEIYNEDVLNDVLLFDSNIIVNNNNLNVINNYTNLVLENYYNESKYYILLLKGINEFINNHNKDTFIKFLEKEFNLDYKETLNKITKIYQTNFCEEPNFSLCSVPKEQLNKIPELYSYIAKLIIVIDDIKSIKYIKSDIIVDYIYIAKKYNPNITISRDLQYKNKCYCNIWYKNLPIDETGKHVCSCGFEAEEIKTDYLFDKTISKKAKDNFRKAFNLLQGNIRPPHYESIVQKLDKYFEKYSINIKKLISLQEYTSTGKIKGTTRDMLIIALKKINQSSHIIYINYYLREYFHWKIKTYKHIEDKVMLLYDETISWFVKVKDPSRNSAPNVWYHLLWLLLEIGEECYLEDFKIPENDSLVELENYRKKICQMRHMHFIPIMSMVKN
jgi:hypothetical protein